MDGRGQREARRRATECCFGSRAILEVVASTLRWSSCGHLQEMVKEGDRVTVTTKDGEAAGCMRTPTPPTAERHH